MTLVFSVVLAFCFVALLLLGGSINPGGGNVPSWALVRVARDLKNLKWNPERKRWEKDENAD